MGVAWLGVASLGRAETVPADAGSSSEWLDRMLQAMRLGDTLAAKLDARTFDHTGSSRDFSLEWLRDARGERVVSVIEVREEGTPKPHVFRFETRPNGSLASWSWDVVWQRFVRVADLDGTEPFAGTHLHLEDLGFTDLAPRRSARLERSRRGGADVVVLTSGAYNYYGRVVMRVDPESALPLATDFYDATGALVWQLGYRDVATLAGRPLVTRAVIENPISRERSELVWRAAALGVRVRDEQFDLEYLDTQMRRGADPLKLPALEALNGPLPPPPPLPR